MQQSMQWAMQEEHVSMSYSIRGLNQKMSYITTTVPAREPTWREGSNQVAEMLERNQTLEELWLSYCTSLGVSGVTRLIESLQHNTKLRLLRLPREYRDNVISSELYKKVQSRHIVGWW